MQYKASFVSLLALSAPALSFSMPDLSPANLFTRDILTKKAACPAVWKDISNELKGLMVTNLQCNDVARAMIRAAFHDCFPAVSSKFGCPKKIKCLTHRRVVVMALLPDPASSPVPRTPPWSLTSPRWSLWHRSTRSPTQT